MIKITCQYLQTTPQSGKIIVWLDEIKKNLLVEVVQKTYKNKYEKLMKLYST